MTESSSTFRQSCLCGQKRRKEQRVLDMLGKGEHIAAPFGTCFNCLQCETIVIKLATSQPEKKKQYIFLRQAEPYGPQHDQRMFECCVEKKPLLFDTMIHLDERGPS